MPGFNEHQIITQSLITQTSAPDSSGAPLFLNFLVSELNGP
jgi:hypothetical protein